MRRNNKQLYESIMKDVSKTVKKHLNESSPVSLAKQYVYNKAKQCDFDFDEMEEYLDSDALADFMDEYRLSTTDAHKFMDTMKKIAADENSFNIFINKMKKKDEKEEKIRLQQEKEEQIKTSLKINAANDIIKPLIENNISIVIDGKKKNIKVNEQGNIELY